MNEQDLTGMRREYGTFALTEADAPAHWRPLFTRWLDEAVGSGIAEPNAFVLATAAPDGTPSSRTVLLKSVDESGLVFFTNYQSRKGHELAQNPKASALFGWYALHRQVAIRGDVAVLPAEESDHYFATRPFLSQVAATVSPQSAIVNSRAELEEAFEIARRRYESAGFVPRPPGWGGYRLTPVTVEFWQGRANRLHDRIQYRRSADQWAIERLAP